MSSVHEQAVECLEAYITQQGLQVLQDKEISYGRQFKLTDGSESCVVNIYHSGKTLVQGTKCPFKVQVQEWVNVELPAMLSSQSADAQSEEESKNQSHSNKYIVSSGKYERIRAAINELHAQIEWQESPAAHEIYKADLRSDGYRVVLTQFRTGTLLVQGKQSPLFDEVSATLDAMLAQSPAERAARYVPEKQAFQLKPRMERPEAEAQAWQWLEQQLDREILDYLPEHDRNTLVAGAVLLDAAVNRQMPDFSPLVMPFARAYEGFLIQVFIGIGLADPQEIEKDIDAIRVGAWLEAIPKLLKSPRRDGHIASDLKTAWEGTRHLTMHSDPTRQMVFKTYDEAEQEICGVLIRAMTRGYDAFVLNKMPLKDPAEIETAKTRKEGTQKKSDAGKKNPSKEEPVVRLSVEDENKLVRRLDAAGYKVETYRDTSNPNKWRVGANDLSLFFPRDPGNELIVRGSRQNEFVAWFNEEDSSSAGPKPKPRTPAFLPHIGADEAGKGDYFGPLVTAAVYVDGDTNLELLRLGVRDSKSMSDSTIADLALDIRELCPNVVEVLMPRDYNEAYAAHKNLNRLLAELHAKAIAQLTLQTGCQDVLVDQFAAEAVLEEALQEQIANLNLTQRTKGESDIAVAAASILAREAFVAAIEDFRFKSKMDIPLGSSSPDVVIIGRAIVRKWGKDALDAIAKVDFKTTRKILEN